MPIINGRTTTLKVSIHKPVSTNSIFTEALASGKPLPEDYPRIIHSLPNQKTKCSPKLSQIYNRNSQINTQTVYTKKSRNPSTNSPVKQRPHPHTCPNIRECNIRQCWTKKFLYTSIFPQRWICR